MSDEAAYHVPVMLQECIEGLNINPDGIYVDVTFGGGGHSRAILEKLSAKGRLYAFDQDPDALSNVISDDRFELIHQNFRFLKNNLRLRGVKGVDGILADLGVSSHQFDDAGRGFSIRYDSALDMRMDQVSERNAAEILNGYAEADLHRIFGMYGEIHNAKTLASTIVSARALRPVVTLKDLKDIIHKHIPKNKEHKYMAQVFQALRIEVNEELEALKEFLEQTIDVVKEGGRLVVMSYHSLEDRLVKSFLQRGKFKGDVEKDFFGNEIKPFNVIGRKAKVANGDEVKRNNRARSAKLRIGERLGD